MRRKKGTLIRVEQEILHAVLLLRLRGINEFHGFSLAKEIQDITQAERLRAHSTVAEKDDFSHYNLSGTPPGVGVLR